MRRILKVAAFIMSAAFLLLVFACPQKAEPNGPKEPTRYTVTFNKNANDAVGTMLSQTVEQGTPTALQKNQFTRSNFEFLGWATSPNGEKVYDDEANFTATSNITLYAVWDPNKYTVSFDPNGGTGTMQGQTFSHGISQNLAKNTFTRENYTFIGWATSSDGSKVYNDEQSISIISDMTLYAKWALDIVYVTFDKNDPNATGTMGQQMFAAGISQALNFNSFENYGYHFIGWATLPDGAKVYNDGDTITIASNTTLYAVWELNEYTVSFDSNGGFGTMVSQVFTHGVPQNLSANSFSYGYHTFSGWATSPSGTVEYDDKASFTATRNITLYAVWSEGEAYMTFGEWPQTVLPSDSTVTVDETQTKVVGMFTYYKGSDDNWYFKQEEKAYNYYDATEAEYYKYSDGTQVAKASAGTYRYFKVEPIKWRVLEEKDGKKFLLAENCLMAVQYYDNIISRTIGGKYIYPNNYMHSKIRAWLNGYNYPKCDANNGDTYDCADYQNKGFLQTAFTSEAQAKIATTTVDNSVASTLYSSNSNVCADTDDKVFLLSAKEATNSEYGFESADSYGEGNIRNRKPTDFALATGAYNYGEPHGGGQWWLRSPRDSYVNNVRYITSGGYVNSNGDVSWSVGTVVPALWVTP